jgi:hypothetical protein
VYTIFARFRCCLFLLTKLLNFCVLIYFWVFLLLGGCVVESGSFSIELLVFARF